MFRHSIRQFEQEVVTIHPGEYYVSGDDTVISTVLGSCVAVALFDPHRALGGLNHFMLPGDFRAEELVQNPNAKYGMYAMELLINELLKRGTRKSDLRAKVFGGGAVLRLGESPRARIPRSNVEFAFGYLEKEGIPVLAADVGGRRPRKIFFFPRTGKALLKRLGGALVREVEREEVEYLSSIRAGPLEGPITLFDTERGREPRG